MLQIKDIKKQYITGELTQTALNGVSLNLRDNEFVAILGPSGSGKTTLLNVIGGLDRYDDGDLIINGISTKNYTDRDWDSYRNHTIGFIFQSYNLIPHQTVLANVELALTISGISHAERRRRAKKALEDVGLGNQLHKKPNQMSGGQMQRVAIARALVNNPDILLADEPTGALDSDTSIQVMELLKEVSKDRLVVMVTHNPELAEDYANRIVKLRDGNIIDDSNPYEVEDSELEPPRHENMGKASMSFLTALSLSFNNLKTKKARTLLTSFAGSIGIIGIALILSLSTGFQNYIDKVQEDTLSTYPLTIQSESADMTSMMAAFAAGAADAKEAEDGTLVEQQVIGQVFAQIGTNDLGSFKTYLEANMDEIGNTINAIKYDYGITPQIYSSDTSDGVLKVNPGSLFSSFMGGGQAAYAQSNVFFEMIDNRELLDSQYDVLSGRWPEKYDELILVLSQKNSMTDFLTYTIGLRDPAELDKMVETVMNGEKVDPVGDPLVLTYDDILALKFKLIAPSDLYKYNGEYNVWEDMSTDEAYLKKLVDNGLDLNVVGIVCPKEGVAASALSSGFAYTPELTNFVIETAGKSEIVASQISNTDVDVFTGQKFEDEAAQGSGLDFGNMITVDSNMLSSAFGVDVSEEYISDLMQQYMDELSGSMGEEGAQARTDFNSTLINLCSGMMDNYLSENADPETGKAVINLSDAETIAAEYLATPEAQSMLASLEDKYLIPKESFSSVYSSLLVGYITNCITDAMGSTDTPIIPSPDDSVSPSDPSAPGGTVSPSDTPSIDISDFSASITKDSATSSLASYMSSAIVAGTSSAMAARMAEAVTQTDMAALMGELGYKLMAELAQSFNVDQGKIAAAFNFNMDEEELKRLMEAMSGSNTPKSFESNLRSLGYADLGKPMTMSIFMVDFTAKERFIAFLDNYNEVNKNAGKEDLVINYTDMTGVLMSSVKTIVDSVSYVLIAFVAVSLVVSSIMIGIITYISVLERTKEIGVLRALGASKRNVSQVFNAETFIIGLCAGLLGVGIALLLTIPINAIIGALVEGADIRAQLPTVGAIVLVLLSMGLTLLGGLIPAKKAAKQDPVIALRSE